MSGSPVLCAIGLGANLGDAAQTLQQALAQLARLAHGAVHASSLWRSAPIDALGADYTNAVAVFETTLNAPQLLAQLQSIEAAHGRQRPYPNAPRTLDLDLLLYGSSQIQSPQLTVPHPRLHQRAFVLKPLAQLAQRAECSAWLAPWVSAAAMAAVADQRIELLAL
jgi:2-amino-4-hydroxy-6-hydroxymethyldihydropteridine diphosphokinase